MKEILIIGGNRFVGKLVSKELYNGGYNITLLNRSGNSPVNSAVIRQDRNHIDKVTLHQLINYSQIKEDSKILTVLHFYGLRF